MHVMRSQRVSPSSQRYFSRCRQFAFLRSVYVWATAEFFSEVVEFFNALLDEKTAYRIVFDGVRIPRVSIFSKIM